MHPELLLYLAMGSCSNLTIARWSADEKILIDLQNSNNDPYQNVEQEWMNLLIKKFNPHKTNDFLIKCTIFIFNTK